MKKIIYSAALIFCSVTFFVQIISAGTDSRIVALQSTLSNAGNKISKHLVKAMKDESAEYRNAALEFASSCANEQIYIDLLKYMQKAPATVKIDILNWIANEAADPEKKNILKPLELRFDLTAREAVVNQLNGGSYPVKAAAVKALAGIGDEKSIPTLAALLRESEEPVILLAREALLSFPGNVAQPVARIIPNATDAGKIAAVEVLAARKASPHIHTVFELIRSGSPEVKVASYIALKDLATFNQWVILCGMLESSESQFTPYLQEALITAISSQPPAEQVTVITNRMRQAGEKNKYLYYKVLASTGVDEAFAIIRQGLDDMDPVTQKAAREALPIL
ncbi:MAG: hypothetical protein LUH10_17345 [Tannerellaceae bacterium]|nr:hypothetical protein [Tannerellaceae bacterium]